MDEDKCVAPQWWLMTPACLDLIKPLRYMSDPWKSIFQCCWRTPLGDSYLFRPCDLFYLQIKSCVMKEQTVVRKKIENRKAVSWLIPLSHLSFIKCWHCVRSIYLQSLHEISVTSLLSCHAWCFCKAQILFDTLIGLFLCFNCTIMTKWTG